MDRYSYSKAAFGSETFDKVQRSKILVVGAGGIGCELLKNLVLVGFKYIEIVDLDTIDVSNLNRQFLFRPHDVGQSKASVASNAARAFNPEVTIINHHGNVKEAKFGLPFIKKFDVVLNALDNVDARRHMNRLCLAANKPLIDSGTTGYLGQVMPIIKGHTSCYECAPKPTQKVYPVCTIRSTPDKPVHCIVWAKELFKLLFGKATDSMLYDGGSATSGPVNGNSGGVANEEAGDVSTYMHVVNLSKYVEGSGNGAKPTEDVVLSATRELLLGLFRSDLQKRIDMGVYKAAKQSPVPLPERAADQAVAAVLMAVRTIGTVKLIQLLHDAVQNGESLNDVISQSENIGAAVAKCSNCDAGANQWDQIALPLEEAALEFILSIFLATMVCYSPKISVSTTKPHQLASFYQIGLMEFDKDDAFAMRFVALSANLRCRAFHIAAESFHDCKGIAGNIIPAIAATNAIVAGMQVMQAVRILALDSGNCAAAAAACPHTYCNRSASRKGVYLMPTSAEKPYTDCFVCNRSQLLLKIDTMVATLGDVVSHVLKSKLGFNAPSVYLGEGCCLYEEGEDADEDLAANLVLILSRCPAGGIVDGSVLSVDDMTQDLEVQILVEHTDAAEFDEKEQPHGFTISGGNSKAKSVAETTSTPTTSATAGDTCDSDEACLSVNAESNSTSASKKRPREQE